MSLYLIELHKPEGFITEIKKARL